MELLSIELGRSVQLVVPDEVRSTKGISMLESIRLLMDRYNFAIPPNIEEAQKSGLKFKEGRIVSGNKMINIKELGFYNDGVIADTYDTSDSDFVVNDAINWERQVLGMREPKTIIRRKYVSNIVAILDERAVHGIAAIDKVSEISRAALSTVYGVDAPISLSGMGWNSDLAPSSTTFLSADFGFVRRLNRPYNENRFFFAAPIPTDVHLRWIADLEAALIG